jgi:surface-anchored protein
MTASRHSNTLAILLVIFSPLLSSVGGHAPHTDHEHEYDHGHDHAHAALGETAYYLAEHGDLEIEFEDGRLELHVHLHAGAIVNGKALDVDTSFHPDDMIIVATQAAWTLRPADPLWGPAGVDANEPLWVLPQHEKEGLPAFGLSTDELPTGVFVDNLVTLHLRHVKGPGDFSLWVADAFGRPGFLLSTHDRILSTPLPVGLHSHNNWGFTQPGTYSLVLEVTGDLLAGGTARALSIFTFLVSERPVPLETLAADVNGDGVVDETDLQIVEEHLGRTVPLWPPADHDHHDGHHSTE